MAVGGGFRVTGPDGTDMVMGVERLQFADGTFDTADLVSKPPSQPASETATPSTGTGTAGNDNLVGNNVANTFQAYGGNDRVVGLGGNDSLYGGAGRDELVGNDGNDLLSGGAGNDEIYGGAGTDTAVFSGRTTDYTIVAVGGGYRVTGTDGTDTVLGVERFQFSDDTLTVAEFLNLVDDDTPTQPEAAVDEPVTPPSTGTTNDDGGIAVALKGDLVKSTNNGLDLDFDDPSGTGFKGISIVAVDQNSDLKVALGNRAQEAYVIYEDGAQATINGKVIEANAWTTQFNRIEPDGPAISGSALNTALQLGSIITDSWKITGTDKNDTISGLSRSEVLEGGRGSDHIEGNRGWDHIFGGNGWDKIEGGKGQDKLYGGIGKDTFIISEGDGTDTIYDLEAGDRLAIEGFDFTNLTQVRNRLEDRADGTSFLNLGNGDGFILAGDSQQSLNDVDIILG